jgi:hypothetical protein
MYKITPFLAWLENDLKGTRLRGNAILVFTHSYDNPDQFADPEERSCVCWVLVKALP